MKTFITFLVTTLMAVSSYAQYDRDRDYRRNNQNQYGYGQTVTINFDGKGRDNNAYQVIVDGTTYTSRYNNNNNGGRNNNGNWNRNTSNKYDDDDITINNVQPGQHTIQVYRMRSNNRTRTFGNTAPLYSSTFNLRQGFDVKLDIKENGQIRYTEKRSNNGRDRDNDGRRNGGYNNGGYNNGGYNNGGYNNGGYRTPMADYQFSQIYQDVKSKWFQNNKVAAIREAFTNTASYFSTTQVMQLLQLITSESSRLGLAKESYRVIADPANFTQVYSLFSQSSREELDRYIRSYRYN